MKHTRKIRTNAAMRREIERIHAMDTSTMHCIEKSDNLACKNNQDGRSTALFNLSVSVIESDKGKLIFDG